MTKAMEFLKKEQLERFEALPIYDQRKLLFKLDEIARDKGYKSEKELHQEKTYIWDQWCADLMTQMFPNKKF